jgi:hypothetical protein
MKYVAASAILLFGLAACSGPAGVTPSGGLMYTVPATSSVVYVAESTQDITMDAGPMGTMNMTANSEAELGMAFATGTDGVQVTTTFQKVSASMSNPMAGPQTASESDIDGQLVFTIDKRGRGTLVSAPKVKGAAEQLISPSSFVYEFFPRLPGGAANPGDMWTDTIQYEINMSQGDVSSKSILTYTLVGDTVVDGVTLLHVSYEGDAEAVGTGMTEGTEVIQSFAGDVVGMFLWDPARSLMVSGESSQDLDGTVEVVGVGLPTMPMSITGSSSVHLQGG